ncbi:LOW QUALITY PROTEIN: GH-71 [Psilocybe cyanescens]|uniref:GH-71 n=1 Tax=Psilocybe cyanescens TaxID=93625 RepID=A0A409WXJ4_PSICY|nr:LOW QUALITY PROTEIN: GH-71 [Psilocybe cyanescens]
MRISLFNALVLTSLFISSTAALQQGAHTSSIRRRRNWSLYSNRTALQTDDPAELKKRDGTKYVFMHHVSWALFFFSYFNQLFSLDCGQYPYTYADWLDDMYKIAAKGVDAIALNIGSDDWQRNQVATAYAAAQASNTGIKLFYSFDLTEMPCDLGDLVARVNLYNNHPNQFKVNGKNFISSYSGDCLGNSGWQSLKDQTNGYIMPFVWGLEGNFNSWPSLDSWYCWGCAWPQGNFAKNISASWGANTPQLSAHGCMIRTCMNTLFRADCKLHSLSSTHYSYKNFYLRGDDWLVVSRWEQLMQLRSTLTFVELVTWNDYGESDYYGPIKGAQPDGTTWANGFPHTAWYDLTGYYIQAFKTGSYPAITQDVIYFWARPHPAAATASGDSLGKPTGWNWTEDSMWAAVFATSPATVVLTCGGSTSTFTVAAGVNKLKIPLAAGKMTVQMIRNGQTIINYTPSDYTYVLNPVNPPPVSSSSSTSSSATSSSSSSSSSTSSSTSASATSTPVPGWTYQGCYVDSDPRVLPENGPFSTNTMTISTCLARCQAGNYLYAGVESRNECFCSNTIRNGAVLTSASDCNTPCVGNPTDTCGGVWRINIYKAGGSSSTSTTPTSTATSTTPTSTPTGWSTLGCVAEGTSGSRRALTAASFTQSNMTPQLCQGLCSGYQYAGVEAGSECYCGNSLTNNGASGNVIDNGSCQWSCSGDSSQKCGGSWTLNVYTKSTTTPPSTGAWSPAGCFVDADSRMLRGSFVSLPGSLTVESCTNVCNGAGYTMAALEYGQECYCGSQLYKDGGAGVSVDAGQCNMACSG